jgi:hypothetical protein
VHARHFGHKTDAQRWLDEVTASTLAGTYVSPRTARTTVSEWCETWLAGYATRRPSTVRQARVHVAQITAEFGDMPLAAVRPSHVRSWTSRLRDENLSVSYVYALHSRLAQIMADAVHDGIVPRSPCSRRTSPGPGRQRAYAATTEQVWALHDAMPERLRERQDDARHLRAPVARQRRVHPGGCRCGARHAGGESCGLCAD